MKMKSTEKESLVDKNTDSYSSDSECLEEVYKCSGIFTFFYFMKVFIRNLWVDKTALYNVYLCLHVAV